MKDYPWYEVVSEEDELMQGDFIIDCPVVISPSEISDDIKVRIINYDVVIMSQSCDLVQRKLDSVLVCPVWPLNEFEKKSKLFKSKNGKKLC
ncbi:MAG: hypothetical protein ACO2PO_22145 [Candidatus Calescibacterium sp.]